MALAFVGIGSSEQPQINVVQALQLLDTHVQNLQCSPIYSCAPVGYPLEYAACEFLNLVVSFDTDLNSVDLVSKLKQMEVLLGRKPMAEPYAPKVIDLDLLLLGDIVSSEVMMLPDPDILSCAYILLPLSQLAPKQVHPVTKQTYQVLWEQRKNQIAEPQMQLSNLTY